MTDDIDLAQELVARNDERTQERARNIRQDSDVKWYCVSDFGMATLCANRNDAVKSSAEYDRLHPAGAPHVVYAVNWEDLTVRRN